MTKEHLRRLLEMAEAVGYLKCDWEYEDRRAAEARRHPLYQEDVDAARRVYEEKRAALQAECEAGEPDQEREEARAEKRPLQRDEVKGGQRVQHGFLGRGSVVQVLDRALGLIYVSWDETPPEQYNMGTNPSVVFAEDLQEEGGIAGK